MNRLLLIDDDSELCTMLAEYLATEDFVVDMAHDGNTGLSQARKADYDAIILDVMLPGMNGFDVLRELRQQQQTPVLMLTARGDDIDSIVGLELGADDYLPKPCNPRVLVARLRAILRRRHLPVPEHGDDAEPLSVGPLILEPGNRRALLHGKPLTLTSTEFSVLEVLLRKAGQVVSKETLSEQALGRPLTRYDRSIDMHVSSLRKKLGAVYDKPLTENQSPIQTIRGMGYQYTLTADTTPDNGIHNHA
jgi:two-component system response regulator CpxR